MSVTSTEEKITSWEWDFGEVEKGFCETPLVSMVFGPSGYTCSLRPCSLHVSSRCSDWCPVCLESMLDFQYCILYVVQNFLNEFRVQRALNRVAFTLVIDVNMDEISLEALSSSSRTLSHSSSPVTKSLWNVWQGLMVLSLKCSPPPPPRGFYDITFFFFFILISCQGYFSSSLISFPNP